MNRLTVPADRVVVPTWLDDLDWPALAAAGLALALTVAVIVAAVVAARRSVARGGWSGQRVLITVAILAAVMVAGIGGVRSFKAVSERFDSALVPLVADGMIVACTALRLAALTRGWRIPGALVTTYVFIGGTVWLNVATANGVADAVAHAVAPLAYAVLVEMLAHLLRLHLRLAQPSKPTLSGLTWFTSPVITTRVWLHLARTGTDDPVAARALVQQVVRMASRLATLCPSRRLWPLDSARAARTAALQTVRDGLLAAGQLAALLPAAGPLTPGELLGLVDSAALGLTHATTHTDSGARAGASTDDHATAPTAPTGPPVWLVAYLLGALRTAPTGAPVHPSPRTAPAAPVHHGTPSGAPAPVHHGTPSGAPAPVHAPHRTDNSNNTAVTRGQASGAAPRKSAAPSNHELLDVVMRYAAEHGGAPLGQREIRRATEGAFGHPVGFPRAKRLQELAGWTKPTNATPDDQEPPAKTQGQLQLVTATGQTPTENPTNDETEATSTR